MLFRAACWRLDAVQLQQTNNCGCWRPVPHTSHPLRPAWVCSCSIVCTVYAFGPSIHSFESTTTHVLYLHASNFPSMFFLDDSPRIRCKPYDAKNDTNSDTYQRFIRTGKAHHTGRTVAYYYVSAHRPLPTRLTRNNSFLPLHSFRNEQGTSQKSGQHQTCCFVNGGWRALQYCCPQSMHAYSNTHSTDWRLTGWSTIIAS